MAGIKFHAAIDVEISRNHIYRTCRGLWLDWMAQGTRVSGNLFHDNAARICSSRWITGRSWWTTTFFFRPTALLDRFARRRLRPQPDRGRIGFDPFDARLTPFHKAHSTELAGMHDNPCGDDRFYNNLFVQRGDLSPYDAARLPVWMDGNVFLKRQALQA